MIPALHPFDDANRRLASNVRPDDWTQPVAESPYHLVVIGGGTAGLVAAVGAAQLGARVALIERELLGGDCLNVGCVPSKALIASAKRFASIRSSHVLGIEPPDISLDFAAVMKRMRVLRAQISPHDSASRLKSLGVDVFFGEGRFVDESTVEVAGELLHFRKALITTGTSPKRPDIPGIGESNVHTNTSIFSLETLPKHMLVLGGGPIGCELAQAFRAFGSQVTVVEKNSRLLPRDDEDASRIIQEDFSESGIRVMCNANATALHGVGNGATELHIGNKVLEPADTVLLASGRQPNIAGLDLPKAGVQVSANGIVVDDYLRTTNRHIYAAGDVCSRFKFTHAADFMARIVIQNALFALGPFGRKRMSDLIVPWVTYTHPEVAQVGHHERSAASSGTPVDVYELPLDSVDRSILDSETKGFAKVLTQKGKDKILGATIVAPNAGEMISEITMAINHRIRLGAVASVIHPYPTASDVIRKLGDQFNRTRLTPRNRSLLHRLLRFNVGK